MKWKVRLIWLLLFGAFIFLTFNKHSKGEFYSYQGVVHADKAGYYIYLPMVINNGMDVAQLPNSIVEKTGEGFFINDSTNRFETKYPSGVAILQSPFYLTAHLYSKISGEDTSGFSPAYFAAVNVAAIFYFLLGCAILFALLKGLYSAKVAGITVALIALGTNLYYYAVDETAMSHVYSFFLFSGFLYLTHHWERFGKKKVGYGAILGIVAGLIVVVRPINLVFVLIMVLYYLRNAQVRNIVLTRKFMLTFLLFSFLMVLPQMLYWNWAFGSYLSYSYQGESFTNWKSPWLAEVLFAPNNGLIPYSPLYAFLLISVIWMMLKKQSFSVLIMVQFLVILYITSSWWIPCFGCGYGGRNFVEYLPLLAIALGYALTQIDQVKARYIIYPILGILVVYNLKLIYVYDECWFGAHDWDWQAYFKYLGDF